MKCYMSELGKDDGRCDNTAVYQAELNWSCQPSWFLCEEHAREEREDDSVVWIKSLERL